MAATFNDVFVASFFAIVIKIHKDWNNNVNALSKKKRRLERFLEKSWNNHEKMLKISNSTFNVYLAMVQSVRNSDSTMFVWSS